MAFNDNWEDPTVATKTGDPAVDELVSAAGRLEDERRRVAMRNLGPTIALQHSRDIEDSAAKLQQQLDQLTADGLVGTADYAVVKGALANTRDRAWRDRILATSGNGDPEQDDREEREERERAREALVLAAAVVFGQRDQFRNDFYNSFQANQALFADPATRGAAEAQLNAMLDGQFDEVVRDPSGAAAQAYGAWLDGNGSGLDGADQFARNRWNHYQVELHGWRRDEFADKFSTWTDSLQRDFGTVSSDEQAQRIRYVDGAVHDQFDWVVEQGPAAVTAYEARFGADRAGDGRASDRFLADRWQHYTQELHQYERDRFQGQFNDRAAALNQQWSSFDESQRTAARVGMRRDVRSHFDDVMARGGDAAAVYEERFSAQGTGARTAADQYLAREWQQYGRELQQVEQAQREQEEERLRTEERQRDQQVVDQRQRRDEQTRQEQRIAGDAARTDEQAAFQGIDPKTLSTEEFLAAQRGQTVEQTRDEQERVDQLADEKAALTARKGSALGLMPDDDNVSEGSYRGMDVTGTPDEIKDLDQQRPEWEDGHIDSIAATGRGFTRSRAAASLRGGGSPDWRLEHEFGPKAHFDPTD
ncbi:MAG: hypothetical protein ACOYNI_01630 [Acidimicrobiia bacterium]